MKFLSGEVARSVLSEYSMRLDLRIKKLAKELLRIITLKSQKYHGCHTDNFEKVLA